MNEQEEYLDLITYGNVEFGGQPEGYTPVSQQGMHQVAPPTSDDDQAIYENSESPQPKSQNNKPGNIAQSSKPPKPKIKPKPTGLAGLLSDELTKFSQRRQATEDNSTPKPSESQRKIDTSNRVIPSPPVDVGKPEVRYTGETSIGQQETPEELYDSPRTFADDPLPLINFRKLDSDRQSLHTAPSEKESLHSEKTDVKPNDVALPTQRSDVGSRVSCRDVRWPVIFALLTVLSMAGNCFFIWLLWQAEIPSLPVPVAQSPCTFPFKDVLQRWTTYDTHISNDAGLLLNVASVYRDAYCEASSTYGTSKYNFSRCGFALDGRQSWSDATAVTMNWKTEMGKLTGEWMTINFPVNYTVMAAEFVESMDSRRVYQIKLMFPGSIEHTFQLSKETRFEVTGRQVSRVLFNGTKTDYVKVFIADADKNSNYTIEFEEIRIFGYGVPDRNCCAPGMAHYNEALKRCYEVGYKVNSSFERSFCRDRGADVLMLPSLSECIFLKPLVQSKDDVFTEDNSNFWGQCDSDDIRRNSTGRNTSTVVCARDSFCPNQPRED